jgi:hypothetical protein
MKLIRAGAFLITTSSGALILHAQPAAIQQFQNNQLNQQLQPPAPNLAAGTNAPELFPGENADVGPQRILRANPPPTYFDVLLDSQFFYSDNANYATSRNALGSTIFVNTAQGAVTSPVFKLGPGSAAAAAGISSQWYNYGNPGLHNLDFNATTIFASGNYNIGKWLIAPGVNLTRLFNQANYDITYSEVLPNFGVQRAIPLNDRMFFSVGNLVQYHFTDVPITAGEILGRSNINNRFDNIASLTFTWQPTRRFVIQPYYRFQYSYYSHDTLYTSVQSDTSDRNDYIQSFGLTAAYYFNSKFSARIFYNYNYRQSSDQLAPPYHEMNGGLGLTLNLKF